MELLIGCGRSKEKRILLNGNKEWSKLITLDMNPDHKPDVICELGRGPWPFPDSTFDEVHAYEVLEHLGQQGDWRRFFHDFSEAWRILKPGGFLVATVPNEKSPWAWGDPSHTRIINRLSLVFLDQSEYERQIGVTSMSDFRPWYKADLRLVWSEETPEQFSFVLEAVKPSRRRE